MMAARFRSVTWVAVALVPALGCYLVTQYVAAERAQLAKVERQIGASRKEIRDLETELGTRGSMAQIERWNGKTFALAAPTAQQFIAGDVKLASLKSLPALAPRPAIAVASAAVAEVRQAAFHAATPAPAPTTAGMVARTAGQTIASRTEVREVAFRPAPKRAVAEPEAEAQPLLRRTTYTKPPRDEVRQAPTKVAMLTGGPLDAGTLADIGRIARSERGSRRP